MHTREMQRPPVLAASALWLACRFHRPPNNPQVNELLLPTLAPAWRTCSMPNQGSCAFAFSIASAHAARVLVGMGLRGVTLPSGVMRGGS